MPKPAAPAPRATTRGTTAPASYAEDEDGSSAFDRVDLGVVGNGGVTGALVKTAVFNCGDLISNFDDDGTAGASSGNLCEIILYTTEGSISKSITALTFWPTSRGFAEPPGASAGRPGSFLLRQLAS